MDHCLIGVFPGIDSCVSFEVRECQSFARLKQLKINENVPTVKPEQEF